MPHPPQPAPRRRRRLRPGVWLVVGLGLWLAGRGLGWFGKAPAPLPPAAPPPPSPASPEPAPTGALPAESAAAVATPSPSDPGPDHGAPPAQPMLETRGPTAADDAFHSLRSVFALRLAEGQWGAAAVAFEELERLATAPAAKAVLVAEGTRLDEAVAAAVVRLVELLRSGRILAADAVFAALAEPPSPRTQRALEAALAFGAGRLPGPAAAVTRDTVPQPRPLPARTAMRFTTARGDGTGVVVDARAERVTLRVEGASGVTFPTVAVVDTEPLHADAATAVELAFAALLAGQPRRARLWRAAAGLLPAPAPAPARLSRLDELLP